MRKALTIVAAIAVVVVLVVATVLWRLGGGGAPEQGGGIVAPSGSPEENAAPPTAPEQPDWCPAVQVLAVPGTWESAADDDPHEPAANPNSLLLGVTRPLQERFAGGDVDVWTLPYPAQFRNINAQNELSYDDSRTEGTRLLTEHLGELHGQCQATDFILVGFSQGAVIVGDVASEIGNGRGAIPAERIRGVVAIADGRRTADAGQTVGNPVSGVGAEVALQPLSGLIQPVVPGATMRGPREGGFGTLNDRTMEICAPDDNVCDAPAEVGNALARAQALIEANGVHAAYATNPNVIPGTTAVQWTVDWVAGLIEG